MTPRQEKLIENYVRQKVKKMLKEESQQLDSTELKPILDMINGMAKSSTVERATDNRELKQMLEQVIRLRIEIMTFVENNSQVKFLGTGNGFKLVKK